MPRSLEQRYRTLIRAYPRSYRDRRGDETVATYLECAGDGQTRPSRRDIADVLSGAFRERLGVHAVPGLAAGLRIATPIALALSAGIAISAWLLGPRDLWGTVMTAAWVIATLVWAVVPQYRLAAVGVAWLATLAVLVPMDGQGIGRTTVGGTFGLVDFGNSYYEGFYLGDVLSWRPLHLVAGLLALIGTAAATHRPSSVERAGVLVAVVGLGLQTALTLGEAPVTHDYPGDPQGPTWLGAIWLLPLLAWVVGLVVAARRGGTGLLWAGLLLLVLVPVRAAWEAAKPDFVTWDSMATPAIPGATDILLLSLMIALAVRLRIRQVTVGPRAALATAGAYSLGVAGGLSVCIIGRIAGYRGLAVPAMLLLSVTVVAALLVAVVPLVVRRLLIATALVATLASFTVPAAAPLMAPFTTDAYTAGVLVLLLLVALVTIGGGDRSSPFLMLLVAAIIPSAVVLPFGGLPAWHVSLVLNMLSPFLASAVLLMAGYCAGHALVRREAGWASSVVVFATAAVAFAIVPFGLADARLVGLFVGILTVALVARGATLRARKAPGGLVA